MALDTFSHGLEYIHISKNGNFMVKNTHNLTIEFHFCGFQTGII